MRRGEALVDGCTAGSDAHMNKKMGDGGENATMTTPTTTNPLYNVSRRNSSLCNSLLPDDDDDDASNASGDDDDNGDEREEELDDESSLRRRGCSLTQSYRTRLCQAS